jgi:hypothetical protein
VILQLNTPIHLELKSADGPPHCIVFDLHSVRESRPSHFEKHHPIPSTNLRVPPGHFHQGHCKQTQQWTLSPQSNDHKDYHLRHWSIESPPALLNPPGPKGRLVLPSTLDQSNLSNPLGPRHLRAFGPQLNHLDTVVRPDQPPGFFENVAGYDGQQLPSSAGRQQPHLSDKFKGRGWASPFSGSRLRLDDRETKWSGRGGR